jgi:hypothetical protein
MILSLSQVIDEIHELEHFHALTCSKCQDSFRYHVLQVYADCPKCLAQHKVRALGGGGTEIQDVVDAVLLWAGEGESLEAVLLRHRQIQEDEDA